MTGEEEQNPALVPQETQPQSKTYKVAGQQAVLGHAPGEVFEATLSPATEEVYLTYGHLEVATESQVDQTEGAEVPVEGEQPVQTSQEQE